jgi:hypothetical protein
VEELFCRREVAEPLLIILHEQIVPPTSARWHFVYCFCSSRRVRLDPRHSDCMPTTTTATTVMSARITTTIVRLKHRLCLHLHTQREAYTWCAQTG